MSPPAGSRVAIMAPPGAAYVAATWAVWTAGGIAVPIALAYPAEEIKYILKDAAVGWKGWSGRRINGSARLGSWVGVCV